jgi:hypothetical protein
MACFIEGFHKSEVQDVTEFSSGWYSIFCLLGEKEKKKERETAKGLFFSPGQDVPC